MAEAAKDSPKRVYLVTLVFLALAAAFPIGLMVVNPTLMFERGWEQYLGTAMYLWAVLMLARELNRLWSNERAFRFGTKMLDDWANMIAPAGQAAPASSQAAGTAPQSKRKLPPLAADDQRILPARIRQLASSVTPGRSPSLAQLMDLNREASGLDQEQAAGRFTLTRYILYLLPVIGFIGTVEGISKALMNISRVLPMVKDLDGFMNNLTSVTSALQIAFDSTLLALFLSAALMLVQTLVFRRAEDLLARVDRWVVENILSRIGLESPQAAALSDALAPYMERLHRDLITSTEQTAKALETLAVRLGDGLGSHVERFAETVDRLPPALAGFEQGAQAIGRLGDDMEAMGAVNDSMKRVVAGLARIEAAMSAEHAPDPQLAAIERGIERSCAAIESLSSSFASSFERSSRATQEQLARTMSSLKDALELLQVSMEQGNALYRNIVKKMFDERHGNGHGNGHGPANGYDTVHMT